VLPASTASSHKPGKSIQQTETYQQVRVSQFQMGMLVSLTLWAPTRESGQQAAKIAFQRIRALNQIFSDYQPDSELSRLCRQAGQGPVAVSAELFQVLTTARQLAELSGGLYDPTIGPVVRQWRRARQTGKEPTELTAARRLVGYQKMRLDATRQTVELTLPGMLLDLGSIAKGFAGDEALRVLAEQGIRQAAFEAGGDMVLGDPPPGESGWPVDIGKPAERGLSDNTGSPSKPLRLANCAVSVSGDTVQYFERNGRRTSHVIDPRTGQGTSSHRMCVVTGPRGALTDPLATIGTLMPPVTYENLMRQHFPQLRSFVFRAPDQNDLLPPRIPPP
jgi:thiamine biosynthesis lipoprotein